MCVYERHPIDGVLISNAPFISGKPQRILECRLVLPREMTDAIVALASASRQPLADAVKGMLAEHLVSKGVLTVSPEGER